MKVESGKLKLRYMTIKKKTKREKTKKKVKKRLKLGRERERKRWKGFSSLVEGTLLVDAFIVLDNRINLSCRSW